jgi:multicomponent Na+:H+ antiporter subunit D
MPWTSAAMVVAGLSLIGVPGTAGFLSKWLLVEAALAQSIWPIALMIVASSLLAVIYVWKLIETLYLAQPAEGLQDQNVPLMMMIPLWVMALACIYFGFDTDITLSAARSAAEGLLAGSAGMR